MWLNPAFEEGRTHEFTKETQRPQEGGIDPVGALFGARSPEGSLDREGAALNSEMNRLAPVSLPVPQPRSPLVPKSPASVVSVSIHYNACDHLGTPRLRMDEQASFPECRHFEASSLKLTPFTPALAPSRFTVHERDEASSYDYIHFRLYASSVRLFLKPDAITGNVFDPQSWNVYAYVGYNPVGRNDPTGRRANLATPRAHTSRLRAAGPLGQRSHCTMSSAVLYGRRVITPVQNKWPSCLRSQAGRVPRRRRGSRVWPFTRRVSG